MLKSVLLGALFAACVLAAACCTLWLLLVAALGIGGLWHGDAGAFVAMLTREHNGQLLGLATGVLAASLLVIARLRRQWRGRGRA